MRSVIALVAFVACVQAISYADVLAAEWESFKEEYEKSYESEDEELLRKLIFYDNKRMIDTHNKRYEEGEESYAMGVNQFTDMLAKEFASQMLSSLNMTDDTSDIDIIYAAPEHLAVPASIDWRSKGAVTAVKNQGNCGSCWAFSVVGSLESQHFLKTRQLVSLSEQNLMDCTSRPPYNNRGCQGGALLPSFEYIKDNGGINTADSYPYVEHQQKCRFNPRTIGATVRGTMTLKPNNEANLADVLASKGPVSVAIHASYKFVHYDHGVFVDDTCNKPGNHAVLVVGYGHDNSGGDYWLVKNSWGSSWGNAGYIRMARNRNNQCGIASHAIIPLV